jgi:hypothetical protein
LGLSCRFTEKEAIKQFELPFDNKNFVSASSFVSFDTFEQKIGQDDVSLNLADELSCYEADQ